jgi:hypothetical protein
MTAANLAVRPVAPPGSLRPKTASANVVRLLARDRPPIRRQPLICHWRVGDDGRLACHWEPDARIFCTADQFQALSRRG